MTAMMGKYLNGYRPSWYTVPPGWTAWAVAGEAYHRPRALPRDLLAALDHFEECPEITAVLGEAFCNLYKAIKRDEVETFLRVISPWERDHLLLNV